MMVLPCDTVVRIKGSEYVGVIVAITLRKGYTVYDVSYFENGTRTIGSFVPVELEPVVRKKRLEIGFAVPEGGDLNEGN